MEIRAGALALLIAVGFSGCATPYQKAGRSIAGGHEYQRLSEDVFTVSFHANGFTTPGRASDLALLRAAEVALEHNYRYFTIIGERDVSNVGNMQLQQPAYTTATANTIGNTTYVNASTTGGGVTNIPIHKPGAELTIRCFDSSPGGHAGTVVDAQETASRLRGKYRIH